MGGHKGGVGDRNVHVIKTWEPLLTHKLTSCCPTNLKKKECFTFRVYLSNFSVSLIICSLCRSYASMSQFHREAVWARSTHTGSHAGTYMVESVSTDERGIPVVVTCFLQGYRRGQPFHGGQAVYGFLLCVQMLVQISMALCSSSVKGILCATHTFTCLVSHAQVFMCVWERKMKALFSPSLQLQ